MTRIFTTLSAAATVGLGLAFWLGWQIEDSSTATAAAQARVGRHFLTALGALVFAAFVHALVLTYFMGTGRWLEETCAAYRLGPGWQKSSRELKWRLYPLLVLALVLLVATGALGAAADPASATAFRGVGLLSARQVHLLSAIVTLVVNTLVAAFEFVALQRNGRLVSDVLTLVREKRLEHGLDT
jgi:hypothetical protein